MPQGVVEVSLALEGNGGATPLALNENTLLLSPSSPEASFEVSAINGAPQGAYAVRASASVSGDDDAPAITSLPVGVIGRPGELDTTFGNGGYLDYQPEGNCNAEAVLALPDGRFVIFGQALTSKMLVARFHADGTIDDSFGPSQNGRLVVTNRGDFGRPNAVLMPDGRMVVAYDFNNTISIARVLPNGVLDGSFGTGGISGVSTSPGNHTAFVMGPDGSMIFGGDFFHETDRAQRAMLIELRANGSLDSPGFGGFGSVEVKFLQMPGGNEGSSGIEALALQSNGNVVAVGGHHAMPNDVPAGGCSQFACSRPDSPTRPSARAPCKRSSSTPTSSATTSRACPS